MENFVKKRGSGMYESIDTIEWEGMLRMLIEAVQVFLENAKNW